MKEVEALRKINKSGVSIEAISREIGISAQTIRRWLWGQNKPGQMALMLVRAYLEKRGV